MADKVIDQGRFWWPAGLPGEETVRVLFNLAQAEAPAALTVENYETREPYEVEASFVRQGVGKWARWTGADVKFKRPEQRGKPFRWTLTG